MSQNLSIQNQLKHLITCVVGRLRNSNYPADVVDQLNQLSEQVQEPFVLAVVGMVKAGKSSLVNALLDDDLAMVGATETTATVTWFRYGRPDPLLPVRCYWRGSTKHSPEDCPKSFLDRLQGDDEETLRLGRDIEQIEFLVDNPWLESLALVDTPGLGASSDEHQNRTAEFVRLNALLRESHQEETRQLGRQADAVLYVLSPAQRDHDRTFLEEFQRLLCPGTSAFNAVAVIGRHDDIENGDARAKILASKLGNKVNDVIPTSAGISRLVRRFRNAPDDFTDFMRFVSETADGSFEVMTDSPHLFLTWKDFPLSEERRLELVGAEPWASFQAAACYARKHPEADVLSELNRLAGLGRLRNLIDRTFVARGPILRCHRIAQNAEQIVKESGYDFLETCRKADLAEKEAGRRYLDLLNRLAPVCLPQNEATMRELMDYVSTQCSAWTRTTRAKAVISELSAPFTRILRTLEILSDDLIALEATVANQAEFTEDEVKELKAMFGNHGPDISERLRFSTQPKEYVQSRQLYWHQRYVETDNDPVKSVALSARKRYESLLYELMNEPMDSV